jgi:signal peptidase I
MLRLVSSQAERSLYKGARCQQHCLLHQQRVMLISQQSVAQSTVLSRAHVRPVDTAKRRMTSSTTADKSVSRKERRLIEKQEKMKERKARLLQQKTPSNAVEPPVSPPPQPTAVDESSRFQRLSRKVQLRWSLIQSRKIHSYTQEERIAILKRLPLWLAIVFVMMWEETSPIRIHQIRGPSMLPTIAADVSDVWLRYTGTGILRRLGWHPSYQRGDIVGFAYSDSYVSCKRIIGLPGDVVQRYGQYVHLFADTDSWGIQPAQSDEDHAWIDPSCPWDVNYCQREKEKEAKRTIVVPDGHVWLEGDCPYLSVDSRHYGPVPIEKLNGRFVGRLWPLWRSYGESRKGLRQRPHPISLDTASLAIHNVHRVGAISSKSDSKDISVGVIDTVASTNDSNTQHQQENKMSSNVGSST